LQAEGIVGLALVVMTIRLEDTLSGSLGHFVWTRDRH
jgi:hypothetical protein